MRDIFLNIFSFTLYFWGLELVNVKFCSLPNNLTTEIALVLDLGFYSTSRELSTSQAVNLLPPISLPSPTLPDSYPQSPSRKRPHTPKLN